MISFMRLYLSISSPMPMLVKVVLVESDVRQSWQGGEDIAETLGIKFS